MAVSFRENSFQQIALSDKIFNMTDRENKALKNSWAYIFAEEIFPCIDEKRFAVLYSDVASRPNTPVNVCVGALIIKELFDHSDDEMVENLMLDIRYQYALHTTSFAEQPLSDKTLSRFRKRCYDYETLHGIDLFHECVKNLGEKIAKMMQLNGRIRRMDSMMIEANIKNLSRMELVYTCIAKLARYLKKHQPDLLPEEMEHYNDPEDYNRIFYHMKQEDVQGQRQILLNDMELLLKNCDTGFEDVTEYELFLRCVCEQTCVEEGKRRFCSKEDKQLNSRSMSNPSDPEATYRKKGEGHRGYIANLEETLGKTGSFITDYEYEQNIYADQQFMKDRLEELPKQEESMLLITDGGYYSIENTELAEKKNIELRTTGLTGKDAKDILNEFEYSEDQRKVEKCPAGYKPRSSCYIEANERIKVTFSRAQCEGCPHKEQCRPKMFKRTARIFIYSTGLKRAQLQRKIGSEQYRDYVRLRNGIETVPSNLRRNYHLEKLPRGKKRGKFFFGCKIAALNFRKLYNYRKGLGDYAPNPLLA